MLTIRLLGAPAIERDGDPIRPPRGLKSWALLGYVLLSRRPVSRRRLAELLFPNAADPLGALRWSLAQVRRALGVPHSFTGDPVVAGLGTGVSIDVEDLPRAHPTALLDMDGELLSGVDVTSSPEFESWLLVERHRLAAMLESRLQAAALSALAVARAREAVAFASRAVALNPWEVSNHELLVRSLVMAGAREAAVRQAAVCEELFERELGVRTSATVRRALQQPLPRPA